MNSHDGLEAVQTYHSLMNKFTWILDKQRAKIVIVSNGKMGSADRATMSQERVGRRRDTVKRLKIQNDPAHLNVKH